jgi:hypothetical protein
MILKNLRKQDDGSYDFDFTVSPEEAEYLMDFAIQTLIKEGVIKVTSGDSEFGFIEDSDEGSTLQ